MRDRHAHTPDKIIGRKNKNKKNSGETVRQGQGEEGALEFQVSTRDKCSLVGMCMPSYVHLTTLSSNSKIEGLHKLYTPLYVSLSPTHL